MSRLFRGVCKFKWIGFGASASPAALTYNGTKAIASYFTCASTNGSTSFEPVLFHTTLTGAGQVGGRARFYMTTNKALGGWANALKAEVVFGASGKVTGLGSAFCAELALSAGTGSGTYAALEAELIAPSGAALPGTTSFLFCNAGGADVATTIDTTACLIELGTGLTVGSGKFIDTAKGGGANYGGLRVYIPGVGVKWIKLVSAA